MIRRSVKIQIVVFVVMTLLGVSYVGARYAGLAEPLVNPGYTVSASFGESGGIFKGAEVTYRGYKVGEVSNLRLTRGDNGGVLVDMRIDKDTKIPADSMAVVANRSAIGEQYVNLRPQSNGRPFLRAGDVIPRDRTETPLRVETLLVNLDDLATSVDTEDLAIVIDELGKAFVGTSQPLQRFLDSGDKLTQAATDALPETVRLLDDGNTVLQTQVDQANHIKSFAHDLAALTETLKNGDADFRRLLDAGPQAGREIRDLVTRLEPTMPVLLGNLITVNQVSTARLQNLRGMMVAYPLVVAGAYTVTPGDGTAHFGLQLHDRPPVCTKGYEGTDRRSPAETSDTPANTKARCKLPSSSPTTVRGAQNAPRPSGGSGRVALGRSPASSTAGFAEPTLVAGYDPATGQVFGPDGATFVVGSQGGQQALLGKEAWKWLLLGPVAR